MLICIKYRNIKTIKKFKLRFYLIVGIFLFRNYIISIGGMRNFHSFNE